MERFNIWLIRAIIRANSSGARRPSSWVGNSFSYLQLRPNIVTSPIPFKTFIFGFFRWTYLHWEYKLTSKTEPSGGCISCVCVRLHESEFSNSSISSILFFFLSTITCVSVCDLTLFTFQSPEDNCSKKKSIRAPNDATSRRTIMCVSR